MTRTRIGILIAVLLVAGAFLWLYLSSANNKMKAAIASSNGSNYTLELPQDMQPANFNADASFQYRSEAGDYSCIVIDDSKEKIASYGLDYDLETYMKIATRKLDSAGLYVNTSMEVNGMKAMQATIKGKKEGIPTNYILTCIETPSYYYQLVCWSPESKFGTNKDVLESIIQSFTEVPVVVKKE